VRWQKITLVGMGLLGGSLGLVIRQRRLAQWVEGYVRRSASVTECERLGLVDHATLDLEAAVREADLVILCTPLAQMQPLTARMAPVLQRGALVTDVGSVKGSVVAELEPLVARAGGCFVGSHPMAGAEKTGASAARADLFENTVCILTPTTHSDPAAVDCLEAFWRGIGTRLLKLSPELHDELVARCSHLPHALAATLARWVLDPAHGPAQALVCAGGFRDVSRIASGSPEMWRDIALANRRQLSRSLATFLERLRVLQSAIEVGDGAALEALFSEAKARRDGWQAQGAAASTE
jgi:cyclohexadieny/prephenate dehydrogenase